MFVSFWEKKNEVFRYSPVIKRRENMRKAVCSNCGNWFYNHNGMMIYLPPEYDDSMCPKCNRRIDDEIKANKEDLDDNIHQLLKGGV
jgi:hypothetical protein